MSDPNQERALRPIYAFLDSYNYTKALKLTYAKPQCNWPITIALRAHCLERCRRKLDACRELRILISALSRTTSNRSSSDSGNDDFSWCELDELIWILGLGSEGEKSSVGIADSSLTGSSGSGGTSSGGGATSSSGGKGKKGKGKGGSSKSSSSSSASTSKNNVNKTKVEKAPLDLIHILDLPQYKRQEILASSKYIQATFTDVNTLKTEDVLDGVSGTTYVSIENCIEQYKSKFD